MASMRGSNSPKYLYEPSTCADGQQEPRIKQRKGGTLELPPHAWNGLSKIRLTRMALQEFDRRTKREAPAVAKKESAIRGRLLRSDLRHVQDFARKGGPDLSRLRGVSMPRAAHKHSAYTELKFSTPIASAQRTR